MMESSEFEEKEYEGPLNVQLLFNSHIFWPPGQVFEENFGIDSALDAQNIAFWNMLGHTAPMSGVVLQNFNWGYIWRKLGKRKYLPDFKLNLFVQAKRPEYLYGRNNEYARHGIKGPYYRFEVMEHQQQALESLANTLGNRALIVYSCPVFHTNRDLYRYIREHALVENSTFVRVDKLKGHSKWIFDEPGTIGLGCSEIERIEDIPLLEQAEAMIKVARENELSSVESVLENLLLLEKLIIESFESIRKGNAIAEEFFMRDNEYRNRFSNMIEDVRMRAYMRVDLAASLLNVRWYLF